LFSGSELVNTETGEVVIEEVWSVFFAAGSGTWTFLKTGGDEDDQSFGAITARLGGSYKSMVLQSGVDIVQLSGPDIVTPFVAFAYTAF